MAELLTNGGFESWTAGIPDGWEKVGTQTIEEETVDVQSGSAALKCVTTGPLCGVQQVVSSIPASERLRLVLAQHVDEVGLKAGARMAVQLQIVGGTYGGLLLNFLTGEWEAETEANEKNLELLTRPIDSRYVKIGHEFTFPAQEAGLRVKIKRHDGVAFSFLVDSASLEAVSFTPATSVDWGIYEKGVPDEPAKLDAFIAAFGHPDYVGMYREWGSAILHESDITVLVSRGAIPVVSWEPRETTKTPTVTEILSGSEDAYIDEQAEVAKAYGKPMVIRPYWEMNIGTLSAERLPLDPDKYIEAWRHIVGRFAAKGVSNVKWFWCPEIDYDRGEGNHEETTHDFFPYFPGDEYVDYVGADGYSTAYYDEVAKRATFSSLSKVFGYTYRCLMAISTKSFFIGETGVAANGEGIESGDKVAWLKDGFLSTIPNELPRTAVVMYFNRHNEGEPQWELTSSPEAEGAFVEVTANSIYSRRPTVTTGAASGIASTKATLHGTVNPNALPTTYYFKLWKEGDEAHPLYTPASKEGNAGGGIEAVAVAAVATGLSQDTSYLFELVASNEDGEATGAQLSFKTGRNPHVIERPPMRQHILATAPSGRTERWGEDEPDAANVLEDFSDSDTAPGGHKDFTGALPRKPGIDYSDMKVGTKLEVMGAGGYKVSEYRLERTPRTSGDFLVMDPAASGYQVLLSDEEGARAIPLDADMSAIGQPSGAFVAAQASKRINLDAQVILLPAGSANSKDSPALQHAWQHLDNEPTGEAFDMAISVYDALGIELGEVLLDCVATDVASMGGGWRREVWAWGDSNAESLNSEVHDFPNETVTDEALTLPSGTRLVAFLTLNRTEPFSGDGKWEVQYRNVKFRDRSSLPLYGTWPEVGILASDFIAWAVSQFAPGIHYTTGAYGSIKPSSFLIPHLAFKEPTAVQQMITQALRFEAMLEWGVWSGQFGPTFYLNERGKREGAKRWRARVRPAKLTETGQQMDQVYNKVVISWRDPDGTTKVMGPPGSGYVLADSRCEDVDPLNPLNEAGLSRTKHLTMEGIATAEGAAETARLFLEKVKLLDASGEATLTGFVEDDSGAEWPYYCVHAGDEIEFIDSSISGLRYIVEARRNRKARAVNIKIDAPPDSYEALLAELQVRETAAGLS